MAQQTIADGETITVADGETYEAGPLVLDGTLELEGTADIGEHSIQASAGAGVTATGVVSIVPGGPLSASPALGLSASATASKTKNLAGSSQAGTTATGVVAGEKNLLVAAAGGLESTGGLSKEKVIIAAANMGLQANGILESMVPLRRRTATGIDNTRRDEFDTQGTGETE